VFSVVDFVLDQSLGSRQIPGLNSRLSELPSFNAGYLIPPHPRWEDSNLQAAGLDTTRGRLTYHKQRLLTFGEYVPAWAGWLLPFWRTSFSFAAATSSQHPVPFNRTALAPSICFEAIWPGAMNTMVRDGAELLVNITDDGWFEGTIAP